MDDGTPLLLRWNVDAALAARLTAANTSDAEPYDYWSSRTSFLAELALDARDTTFYDSRSGAPIFRVAAADREAFLAESREHGWPSFRDEHAVAELVERDGFEVASAAGTHLGHATPDPDGRRRYCVNLASVAGWARGARETLRVRGRRGARVRAGPALDSEALGLIPRDAVVEALGELDVGAKRRLYVASGATRGWITDDPKVCERVDDAGILTTCCFVTRSDGRPVSPAKLIREFERSTALRAPAGAAAWSLTDISLFFMSTGAIAPPAA